MKTEKLFVDADKSDKGIISRAARYLQKGELVAFPTETVYGLGANALDAKAVNRIFEAKGRPQDNPLIVHVSSIEMAQELVLDDLSDYKWLVELLWPGPVTIIFRKARKIPDIVTAGLPTVGIRFPSHPVAQKLIEIAGLPIAAPSANLSGRPSPTDEFHVIEDMDGRIACMLLAGKTLFGLESTIVDLSRGKPTLLRPGPISVERLKTLLPDLEVPEFVKAEEKYSGPALAPGMKYRHYSPKIELILVEGDPRERYKEITDFAFEKNSIILCSRETAHLYPREIRRIVLGSRENLYEVAANLFDALREPGEEFERMVSESFPESGVGLAIMNRLRKAAWKIM